VAVRESQLNGLGRAQRNKRDKLERIKRAARRLFERKGFDAATMREIAQAADIGHGTLFLYAGGKEDLLVMIFREELGGATDLAFTTMPRRPLLDRLMHLFGAMIAHHERNTNLARAFVKELPFVNDSRHGVAEFMSGLFARIARLVEDAQSLGELRAGVAPTPLAHNFFALYFSLLQRWLGHQNLTPAQLDTRLRAALELQLAGLRTPEFMAAKRPPEADGRARRAKSKSTSGESSRGGAIPEPRHPEPGPPRRSKRSTDDGSSHRNRVPQRT